MSTNTYRIFLKTAIPLLVCSTPFFVDIAFWSDAEGFLSGLERTFTNQPQNQPQSSLPAQTTTSSTATSPSSTTSTRGTTSGNSNTTSNGVISNGNSVNNSTNTPSWSGTNPSPSAASGKAATPTTAISGENPSQSWKTTVNWSDADDKISWKTEPNSSAGAGGTSSTPGKTTESSSKDSSIKIGANDLPAALLSAPSECGLPEVEILGVEELPTKSILRWKAIPNVDEYDVYKQTKSGTFALIERTKKNEYTVHLSQKDIRYDEFRIAAVCKDMNVASKNFSKATSVRTGPLGMFVLFIFSLWITAILLRWRKV